MVRAWRLSTTVDINISNYRLENHRDPPEYLDAESVVKLTGVFYKKLDLKTYDKDGSLDAIRQERGYTYEDTLICTTEKMETYNQKMHTVYKEHCHNHDEARFVLEGSGFVDVRDVNDEWVRVQVQPGDLLIIPPPTYHRFTVDMNDYVKAIRFYKGEPIWLAHDRDAEHDELVFDDPEQFLDQLEKIDTK